MRKNLPYLATLLAFASSAALSTAARADDNADIKAAYVKITKAMKAKDIKAVMAMGTEDFSETDKSGKTYSGKETAKMMEEHFKSMKTLDVTMSADKITVNGKTATVLGSYNMSGTMVGPDGKTHTMANSGTSKDTLVKTPKGWLFKKVQSLKENMTMDGKPFDPSQMMAPPSKPKHKPIAKPMTKALEKK
jgi:ketosteroid isomerase-like protein